MNTSIKHSFAARAIPAAVALALQLAVMSAAHADTSIKLVMDWAFEGPQAIWTAAGQSSCFPDKKLKVTIDRGFGSGDAIGKIVSGAYDIGVADFGSVVAYNAQHPENKLMAVYVISEQSPLSVSVLKSSGITKPKDLEGKRIADSQGEASRVMFPAFAKKNGIDPAKVSWVNVAPNLRQTSLVQGQADAAAGHMFTVTQGLKALGVKREDIVTMNYSAYGVEVPGNTVVARPAYLAAHKQEVTDLLSCLTAGIKQSIDDPKTAVATLKKYNSMVDENFEIDGLQFSTSRAVLTPAVMKNGLSEVDKAHLDESLTLIADSMGVPKPAVADIWTADYLPPLSERKIAPK